MKSQSQLVLALKHQIAATLKLIALKIKRYVLQLLDLEQKLEVAMSEQFQKEVVTGLEFAEKVVSTWNSTHGSEWHHLAACFVKASIWDKKDDEVRIYLLNGYISLREAEDKSGKLKFHGFKYDLQDKLVQIVRNLAEQYSIRTLKGTAKVWHDEEGNEVDINIHPADAVAFY